MWFDLLMSLESLATCDTKWFLAPSLLRSCSAATALTACALLMATRLPLTIRSGSTRLHSSSGAAPQPRPSPLAPCSWRRDCPSPSGVVPRAFTPAQELLHSHAHHRLRLAHRHPETTVCNLFKSCCTAMPLSSTVFLSSRDPTMAVSLPKNCTSFSFYHR